MNEPDKINKAKKTKRFSPWRLLPLVILAVGLVAFFAFDLGRYVSLEALQEHRVVLKGWVERNGAAAVLVFGAVYAVMVALSVPGGLIMTVAGGFLFGAGLATVTVVIGATVGATALFLAAKFALGDYLRTRAGPTLQKMEAGFRENALSYLLVLRLVPVFPFWLVNLAPAFLGVSLRTYVVGTFFGIIPGTFVYALVGNGAGAVLEAGGRLDLGVIFKPEILAPIIGLALLALVPVVYKRIKGRRSAS